MNQQTEAGPPFLGDASPTLAAAYIQAARDAIKSGKGSRTVEVERYTLTVGVRRLDDDEKHSARYLGMADFQLVTRVDLGRAKRLGLETHFRKLDLWVGRQESGIDCLFFDWRGQKAPFPAEKWSLSTDESVDPESKWARHIVEKGRFRLFVWTVGPHFDALFGRRRKKS